MVRLLSFVVLVSLFVQGVPDAAERAWIDVTVRVYDAASVAEGDKVRALAIAAEALAPADLEIRFAHCVPPSGDPACNETLGPHELALRLVRGPATRPSFDRRLPLGDAHVDTGKRAGALATIYVNRVEWLAGESRTDPVALLGRAIAHELVHVLTGQSVHAPRGLMRAVWSSREVAGNRAEDWRLSESEKMWLLARLRLGPTSMQAPPR